MTLSRRRFLQVSAAALAAAAGYATLDYLGVFTPVRSASKSALKTVPRVDGKAPIAIVKGENAESTVREAIQLIGGLGQIINPGDKVLIKPNYTWVGGARDTRGQKLASQTQLEVETNTTDPRVVEALVRIVKDAGGRPTIGEGSGGCETLDAFQLRGLDEIADRHAVELIDLNRGDLLKVQNNELDVFPSYWTHRAVQEADVIISVPCLKAWPLTGITVGLKNLIGTAPGDRYGWAKAGLPHGSLAEPTIDRVIADLAVINRINLVVVDGFWGNEGTYTNGFKPVKMDLVIAGFDPVATDSVAASVMGFNPLKIGHLNLARDRGIGTSRMADILVRGRKIDDVAKSFEPPEGLERIVA